MTERRSILDKNTLRIWDIGKHELNSRMKRKKNRAMHAAGHSAHCIEKAAERFEKN